MPPSNLSRFTRRHNGRIRTQMTIMLLLFIVLLAVIVGAAWVLTGRVVAALEQGRLAAAIAENAGRLSYLFNDYAIYGEPQQAARWLAYYDTVRGQVDALVPHDPEEQALVRSVQDGVRRIKEVFDSLAAEPPAAGTLDAARLQIAWSRMGVQTQGLLTDATRLAALQQSQVDDAITLRTRLTYAIIAAFAVFFLINYTVQRRLLRSITALQAGSQVIGAGNLDHRIPVVQTRWGEVDEIGEVSAAFNSMAAGLTRDIAARAQVEAELEESRRELQTYARRLVDATENERQMIARELHDEAGQVMTALKISLARLQRRADLSPEAVTRLQDAKDLVDRVIEDLRTLATTLRPGVLDRAGLAPALEQHIAQFRERTGLEVQLTCRGVGAGRLLPEVETNLYRIAQEALTNAARYARPAHVDVTLEQAGPEIRLTVADDGCGFDVDAGLHKGHLGLLGMRERAEALHGRLTIDSTPGRGAKITVVAPVGPPSAGS